MAGLSAGYWIKMLCVTGSGVAIVCCTAVCKTWEFDVCCLADAFSFRPRSFIDLKQQQLFGLGVCLLDALLFMHFLCAIL